MRLLDLSVKLPSPALQHYGDPRVFTANAKDALAPIAALHDAAMGVVNGLKI